MVLKSDVKIAFKQQQLLLKEKPNGEWREKLAQVSLSKEFVLIITGIRRCTYVFSNYFTYNLNF